MQMPEFDFSNRWTRGNTIAYGIFATAWIAAIVWAMI